MKKIRTIDRYNAYQTELMNRILSVRYTDVEEEKALSKLLLENADPKWNTYSYTFANVYLLDSYLALGEYEKCGEHLIQGSLLCREYGYDDLLLTLCNSGGLYYLKLNDEQSALECYLEGLQAARNLQNHDVESKLLNNIGIAFGSRGDWETAAKYFKGAFQAAEPYPDEVSSTNVNSFLNNLAEACQNLGDTKGSLEAMTYCEKLGVETLYQRIRLACGWCAHHAAMKEWDKCKELVDYTLDMGLLEYQQKYFVGDMCVGLLEHMLNCNDEVRAKKLLRILDSLFLETAVVTRFRVQCLRIAYWEKYGDEEDRAVAYKDYYGILHEMKAAEDKTRAQSILSKIQLTQVILERASMEQRNQELENVSQIDELTGLYNRRYFNKLATKLSMDTQYHTLGLIMIDVDFFKQYNDTYGHFKGDEALQAVADCLRQGATEGVYVSRYGGDEFICLCANLTDTQVEDYVKQVAEALRQKNIVHEASVISDRLTLSIGYCNEPGTTGIDQLVLLADQALYRVKKAGRNGITGQKTE